MINPAKNPPVFRDEAEKMLKAGIDMRSIGWSFINLGPWIRSKAYREQSLWCCDNTEHRWFHYRQRGEEIPLDQLPLGVASNNGLGRYRPKFENMVFAFENGAEAAVFRLTFSGEIL